MSNVMQRIANYFQNDYEGIDKTSPAFEVTVEELREIAGINTERCRLLAMERATYKPALQKLESIKQELINCENENEESGYCGDFEDFQLFHDNKLKFMEDIAMKTINEVIAREREAAKESRDNIVVGNNLEPYEAYCNLRCEEYAKEHEQLAELLEELKAYRESEADVLLKDGQLLYQQGIMDGYNKAIDDFALALKREILCEIHDVSESQKIYDVGSKESEVRSYIMGTLRDVNNRIVDKVEKQLKSGGENDN